MAGQTRPENTARKHASVDEKRVFEGAMTAPDQRAHMVQPSAALHRSRVSEKDAMQSGITPYIFAAPGGFKT
jgi:hypothetical protein